MHAPPAQAADPRRRCLVTGGAGFIGSHLTDHLLALGHDVTVIDDLSTGRRENLADAMAGRSGPGRLRFIEATVSAALAALGPGERFDMVFHLAAAVGVKRVLERPIESVETNVHETSALLRFVASRPPASDGSRHAATLVASSSEVYGKGARTPFAEDDDCVLGPTTASRWSYACSKALDEYLALAYHRQHGVPVVVARLFNTVGPRQVGDYGMVLPAFVAAALAGRPLRVYGDGRQSRCFCDVRDVAPALPALLVCPAAHGLVVNVGSDDEITIEDLALRVIGVLGSASAVERVPYAHAYAPGFEDLRRRVPDLSRLRRTIGFRPRHDLDRTILDLAASLAPPGAPAPGRRVTA
ncbi:MAG: NAD-dependent epimerase/dehydratase family protein [Phycisphaerales bacterium]|nr:NAD-dependent epimerase/dehydratase family protein [Phycisphaerales bacterium]